MRAFLDFDMCGKPTPDDESDELYMCMRVTGHSGECAPVLLHAAKLDGVQFCCRVKLGDPHHDDCPRGSK